MYISNEQYRTVSFDNLNISYYRGRLLDEMHYYPHGLVMKGAGASNAPVQNRYFYQGKELADEGGLQLYDFHARQYDPQVGRFWGIDPADQLPSGYTGMGNDPANGVDPSGMTTVVNQGGSAGEVNVTSSGISHSSMIADEINDDFAAWDAIKAKATVIAVAHGSGQGSSDYWHAVSNMLGLSRMAGSLGRPGLWIDYRGGIDVSNVEGADPRSRALRGSLVGRVWVPAVGHNFENERLAFSTAIKHADFTSQFSKEARCLWNSPLGRAIVPDYISIGGGYSAICGIGSTENIDLNWTLRGPGASWKPSLTTTLGAGGGYSIGATINLTETKYLGDVDDIKRNMLLTNSGHGDIPIIWFAPALSEGLKAGATFGYTPSNGATGYGTFSKQFNIGGGLPAGPLLLNVSGGISNTYLLHDFYTQ